MRATLVGLIPDSRVGGAVATKSYSTKAEFVRDLQRLGYTDGAVARFFEDADQHQTLLRHPLASGIQRCVTHAPA
jgi:hypothetical protein